MISSTVTFWAEKVQGERTEVRVAFAGMQFLCSPVRVPSSNGAICQDLHPAEEPTRGLTRIKDVQTQGNEAKPEQGLLEHVYGSKPRLVRAEKGPEKCSWHLLPPPAALRHESCDFGNRKACRKSHRMTKPNASQQAGV